MLPADYAVSDEPLAIVTLLGSCVAACLYDPLLRIGGMNHFMLPDGEADPGNARYGVHAMELLINALLKRGARRARLLAKVFGGGNVLRGFQDPIGSRNARFVLDYLDAERIPVQASDLGDIHPRKVAFFVQTGRTLVDACRRPATASWSMSNAPTANTSAPAAQRQRRIVLMPAVSTPGRPPTRCLASARCACSSSTIRR